MSALDITVFDTDSLAWLAWHFDNDPADEAAIDAAHPGFPARARTEFAKRLEARGITELLPRHLREGRHPRR